MVVRRSGREATSTFAANGTTATLCCDSSTGAPSLWRRIVTQRLLTFISRRLRMELVDVSSSFGVQESRYRGAEISDCPRPQVSKVLSLIPYTLPGSLEKNGRWLSMASPPHPSTPLHTTQTRTHLLDITPKNVALNRPFSSFGVKKTRTNNRWDVEHCGESAGAALRAGPLGRMSYHPVPAGRSVASRETLYGRLLHAIGEEAASDLWTRLGAEDWLVRTVARCVLTENGARYSAFASFAFYFVFSIKICTSYSG